MNVIDGLGEPVSRVVVMTANDASLLERHKALMRPGRIDCVINIPYVDVDQLCRMFRVFYPAFQVEDFFEASEASTLVDVSTTKSRVVVENLTSTSVVCTVKMHQDDPVAALDVLTRFI